MRDLLVFSIALNGYQWIYRKNLKTHRQYAEKINADYALIDNPKFVSTGTECCWLKIPLILAAFNRGYKSVLFLDADAFVTNSAPDIRLEIDKESDILMAKGVSGRWNSGVIFAINSAKTIEFLNEVLARRREDVDIANSVGWGENGHVIQVASEKDGVSELSLKWNNTFACHLDDYIRHFSAGLLRENRLIIWFHRLLHLLTAKASKFKKSSDIFDDPMHILFSNIVRSHPNAFEYFHF